jgi:hypothetical protein
MKKLIVLLSQVIIILFGCAGVVTKTELPQIELQHPVGYSRLVTLIPECANLNPDNYASCVVASRMLESATTQISTHRFLVHWEAIGFGDSVSPTALEATQRIVIPVLKLLYQSSHDEYSKAMLLQTDKIQLTSRASFDSFMQAHQCLISPEERPECRRQ